jgi:hypothetical protein
VAGRGSPSSTFTRVYRAWTDERIGQRPSRTST